MKVIGVVGGMGSGKSTVVKLISESVKAHVINADYIGHLILKKGHIGYTHIVENFGTEILGQDGEIDRGILGSIVFSDKIKLKALNEISHPLIYDHVKKEINNILQQGIYRYIIIDAALLIEIGLIPLVDQVWGVYAPMDIRVQRVILRNGFSKEEAIRRISSQLPWEEIKKITHIQIDNSKGVGYTKEQVLSALKLG